MDRREFLKTTTGAAAIAATATAAMAGEPPSQSGRASQVAAPAVASGVRLLRLAMAWPDNGRGAGDSARRFALRLETLTDGRIKIIVAEEASGGFAAVARGEADLYHGTANELLGMHRAFTYFAGLPGDAGLGRYDTAAWLTVGGGQMLWDDLAAEFGIKPLLTGCTGQSGALWSKKPVSGLADVSGSKLYAEGLAQDVARALGAEVIDAPVAALSNRLAAGEIDAVQWGGTLAAAVAGLPEAAKYHTSYGLQRHGTLLSVGISRRVWDALPKVDQAIISAAAVEEFQTGVAEARAHDPLMRRILAKSHGVEFAPLPVEIRGAVSRVTDAIVAHVASADARAGRINASYMAFKDVIKGRRGTRAAEAAV